MVAHVQVDEQSVFRHKGERKVKTVEEDMEEVTSRTAELLDEGEELMGRRTQQLTLFAIFKTTMFKCCN